MRVCSRFTSKAVNASQGDNLPLEVKPIAGDYIWAPKAPLPSAVLELAHLYGAIARDVTNKSRTAPTFDDAV